MHLRVFAIPNLGAVNDKGDCLCFTRAMRSWDMNAVCTYSSNIKTIECVCSGSMLCVTNAFRHYHVEFIDTSLIALEIH